MLVRPADPQRDGAACAWRDVSCRQLALMPADASPPAEPGAPQRS